MREIVRTTLSIAIYVRRNKVQLGLVHLSIRWQEITEPVGDEQA
jgi:hypothetical protein